MPFFQIKAFQFEKNTLFCSKSWLLVLICFFFNNSQVLAESKSSDWNKSTISIPPAFFQENDSTTLEPQFSGMVVVTDDLFAVKDFTLEHSFCVIQANSETIPWRLTLWGGIMTDNDLGESFTGKNLDLEDSYFLGLGINRKLFGGESIKVEWELQLLNHFGRQSHLEGTAALALRWVVFSGFSVAVIEGVSYATAIPEIEDENNTDESQFLNYLAFEAEYFYTRRWGIAFRLHHRSGAGGIFNGAIGGSNAYMLGIRHRF